MKYNAKNETAKTLGEILSILEPGRFPHITWVGKNYSKAALIRDLKRLVPNNE